MTQPTNNTNTPLATFKIGRLSASIWQNTTQEGNVYYSTEIVRNYQDKADGDWKKSNQFSHKDLLNIAKLAERAEAHIVTL